MMGTGAFLKKSFGLSIHINVGLQIKRGLVSHWRTCLAYIKHNRKALELKRSGVLVFSFHIFMGKHGKDAIIDKNSHAIIFGDYRENDLAK